MPLSVTINSIEDHGLLVSAGPGIKGMIPKLHASDLGTTKALTKFKVQAPFGIDSCVLKVDLEVQGAGAPDAQVGQKVS
jgi:ribosomal protein S1